MSDFSKKVLSFLKKVPKGKVVSYGQVAAAAGSPRAARQVGGVLRGIDASDAKMPWWRVINNEGFISIKGSWTATKELQRQLLEKEGILVSKDFMIDMDKYRFRL
jgi:methylated-DNA-protein-cysteine methyltransferase related protein